jgi:RNA polymerase sigma-70 factor (ECF subfamily)
LTIRQGAGAEEKTMGLEDVSDAVLVVAIGRWSQEALAESYRRHAGAVLGLARRVLVDRTLAEETVQEVFLRLWKHPEKFDPGRGSLRTYLLTQAHGRAVDVIRSESARREREARDLRRTADTPSDFDREIHDLMLGEQVRQALTVLSEGEREAIELAYFGGHTYRETAIFLGVPEGTVKSRIRSGLRRLREPLTKAGLAL